MMDPESKVIVDQAMDVARRSQEQLRRERERFELERLLLTPSSADMALAQVVRRWYRYGQQPEDWQSVEVLLR